MSPHWYEYWYELPEPFAEPESAQHPEAGMPSEALPGPIVGFVGDSVTGSPAAALTSAVYASAHSSAGALHVPAAGMAPLPGAPRWGMNPSRKR